MYFKNRTEAGKLLAEALGKYKNKDIIVYALPRGGVVTAYEIAKELNAPLDLIITRKIGHRFEPEYAVGAVAENGHIVKEELEGSTIDKKWFHDESKRQQKEAQRRRVKYLSGRKPLSAKGKIAILVDDGIATGLTIKAGVLELKHQNPQKIVVAVPVAPKKVAEQIKKEVDELVVLDAPEFYLGAVGAYYEEFLPIEDEDVIAILKIYEKEQARNISPPKQALPDPVLYSFPSYKYMAQDLKQIPNLTLGKFMLNRFPNNELYVKLQTHAKERDCIVLGNIAPPETNLVSFLLLCHTLQKEDAHKIITVLPYLAYSRADKKEPQKSYSTDLIGKVLSASGVNEVITVDIHSSHVKQLFPIPLISLSPSGVFASEIKKMSLQNATIVAPDEGAIKRCEKIAKETGNINNIAYIEKKRSEKGIKHLNLHGKVGQQAVLVDDILDTGKTLVSACEKLLEKGVKEIHVFVTHGLFTGNEWKKLWGLGVKYIYCTDSIPLPEHAVAKNITVLSIIPLIAEELKEENKGIFEIDASKRYDFYDFGEV